MAVNHEGIPWCTCESPPFRLFVNSVIPIAFCSNRHLRVKIKNEPIPMAMTCLFSDIYDGIRCLRVMKGASEKEILDFVKQRAGNMQVGNMLKTIRTLRKLVEDGILTKKGKRYSFTGKPPKAECYDSEDNEREEDDDDDDDDDEGMDDDDDDDDDDDGCGFENERFCNAGDDDDDDDDDEDDDQDENKQCGGKDKPDENKESLMKEKSPNGSFILRPRVGEGKCGATETQPPKESNKNAVERKGVGESAPDKTEKKAVTDRKKRSDQKPTENEAKMQGSAFCVRDFIDSLARSKTEETPDNLTPRDVPREKSNSRGGFRKTQKRKVERSRLKRSRAAHCSYRSRSPLYDRKSEMYNRLQLNLSDNVGTSNLVLQEPTDANGDVEMKEKSEVKDNDIQRQTSSEGASRLDGTETQNEKPAPCDSRKNLQELMKKETTPEKGTLGVNIPQTIWSMEGDNRQERTKRSPSSEQMKYSSEDKAESLCSVCEKRRKL